MEAGLGHLAVGSALRPELLEHGQQLELPAGLGLAP